MNYGQNAYKKTSIETASSEEILLMLYRTAINHTKMAIKAIEQKRFEDKAKHIDRVQAICVELMEALDFKQDEINATDIAQSLFDLYDFIIQSCTKASIELNTNLLKNILNIWMTLYEGWCEAIKKIKNNNYNK